MARIESKTKDAENRRKIGQMNKHNDRCKSKKKTFTSFQPYWADSGAHIPLNPKPDCLEVGNAARLTVASSTLMYWNSCTGKFCKEGCWPFWAYRGRGLLSRETCRARGHVLDPARVPLACPHPPRLQFSPQLGPHQLLLLSSLLPLLSLL